MASATIKLYPSFFFYFLLLLFFFSAAVLASHQGFISQNYHGHDVKNPTLPQHSLPLSKEEEKSEDDGEIMKGRSYGRRILIGSMAPICTYNECRGCKLYAKKCWAEQVPVEGNDPMNSAYHYKCVCHR
ncbi:EPIDERMAL PATTERNING FACTOR-like protein 9 [Linum perenne]